MKFKRNQVGLITGCFFASLHLLWVLLVISGLAEVYLNWIFGLHFLTNPFQVTSFNFGSAILLLVFTFAVGYILGWVFTGLWNKMVEKK